MKKVIFLVLLIQWSICSGQEENYYVLFESNSLDKCLDQERKYTKIQNSSGEIEFIICNDETFTFNPVKSEPDSIDTKTLKTEQIFTASELRTLFDKRHMKDLKLLRKGELNESNFMKDVNFYIISPISEKRSLRYPVKWQFIKSIE